MTDPLRPHEQEGHEHPVVRDRRRIDPQTGQVRGSGASAPGTTPGPGAGAGPANPAESRDGSATSAPPSAGQLDQGRLLELEAALAERTADLQRLQAEYANYRRRVERDRQAVADQALASVLTGLLPVLDDIDRARAHGESSQGFTTMADGLETTLTKLGLERFGSAGEPFDPTVHEALTHLGSSPDVDTPTCAEVYQPGYRVGQRILRPARVAVADPESPAAGDGVGAGAGAESGTTGAPSGTTGAPSGTDDTAGASDGSE